MMRRFFSGILAALAAAGCGVQAGVDVAEPASATGAIINGAACDAMTHESAVAILVDATMTFGSFGSQQMRVVMCTGTLIAPDTVLTAAHCTDPTLLTQGFGEVTAATYYVSGMADLSALAGTSQTVPELPADAIEVADRVRHPEFSIDNFQTVDGPGNFKDIALMFLSAPMPRVPMHVVGDMEAAAIMQVSTALTVVGWGQQQPGGGPFEPPPAGSVGIKVCAESFLNEVGTFEFQVGGDSSTARKCHGDSGGPSYAVVPGTSDVRVVGVTSHAYDNTDCAKGGVDTRVDVWRSWLDAEMTARCTGGTRVWCGAPGIPPADFIFTRLDDGGVFVGPDAGPAGSSSSSSGNAGSGGDSGGDDDDGAPKMPGCTQADTGVLASLAGGLGLAALVRRRRQVGRSSN